MHGREGPKRDADMDAPSPSESHCFTDWHKQAEAQEIHLSTDVSECNLMPLGFYQLSILFLRETTDGFIYLFCRSTTLQGICKTIETPLL